MNYASPRERALAAIKEFRALIPTLTGYAQAFTGQRVRVQIGSDTETNGKVIYFRPPLALAEDAKHDKSLCRKYDHEGVQRCKACMIREDILFEVFHEIGHISEGTFDTLSDSDKAWAMRRAAETLGDNRRTRGIAEHVERISKRGRANWLELAAHISPFMPTIVNAFDDARINYKMGVTRPGTRRMRRSEEWRMVRDGVRTFDPSTGEEIVRYFHEAGLNHQMMLALYMASAGDGDMAEKAFSEKVIVALKDERIQAICDKALLDLSPRMPYTLAIEAFAVLREYGFFIDPSDDFEEEDEEEDAPEEEDETPSLGIEDDDEDGSDEKSQESDEQDDEGEDSDESTAEDDEADEDSDSEGPEGESDAEGDTPEEGSSVDAENDGELEDGDEGEGEEAEGECDDSLDGLGDQISPEDHADDEGSEGSGGDDPAPEGDVGGSDAADDCDSGDSPGEEGSGSAPNEDDGTEPEDDLGMEAPSSLEGADDEADSGDESGDNDSSGSSGPDLGGMEEEEASDSQGDESDGGEGDDGSSSEVDRGDNQDDGDASEGSGDGEGEGSGAGSAEGGGRDDGDALTSSTESLSEDDTGDALGGDEEGDGDPVDQQDEPEQGWGSANDSQDLLDEVFGHNKHKFDDELDPQELQEVEEMRRAVNISGHFDETPANLAGVNWHREDDHKEIRGINFATAWTHAYESLGMTQSMYSRRELGIDGDFDPDESMLGGTLMRARLAFAQNRRTRNVRHLKAGKVDRRALGKRAPFDDPRLFHKTRRPGKRDYFVVIGLDVSASTLGRELMTMKQSVMAEAEVLSRLGVNFAVFCHSAKGMSDSEWYLDLYEVKSPEEPWNNTTRRRLHEIGPDGGNLDGHTLELYRKVLDERHETDRIIQYYTDGRMPAANGPEELEVLQRNIRLCNDRGYTLMAVALGTDSPREHGFDTVRIDGPEDVPSVVQHLGRRLQQ